MVIILYHIFSLFLSCVLATSVPHMFCRYVGYAAQAQVLPARLAIRAVGGSYSCGGFLEGACDACTAHPLYPLKNTRTHDAGNEKRIDLHFDTCTTVSSLISDSDLHAVSLALASLQT